MATESDLIESFYGNDPLRGEDARLELIRRLGLDAIKVIVPLGGGKGCYSTQVEARLRATGRDLGPAIASHLSEVIAVGKGGNVDSATPCYGGLSETDELTEPLIEVLRKGGDFDRERAAIEALGYLGAWRWASYLVDYSRHGSWRIDDYSRTTTSEYPFEKLSSAVVETLVRLLARATSSDQGSTLVRILIDYIALRDATLGTNRTPSTYQLIDRRGHELTGWSFDPIIQIWGRDGSTDDLREMALSLLGHAAPIRAARFLLDVAMSRSNGPALRTKASIALGEIRHPIAAQILADAVRTRREDRGYLGWAFSALYAVPVDWSGCDDFVEEVLSGAGEPGMQMRYSLALRGEFRDAAALVSSLDSDLSYIRWMAALILARSLGTEGRELFEGRAEEAGDAMEKCGFYAAQLRCGDESCAEALHASLAVADQLPILRTIWKAEILGAFRCAPSFDPRALAIWRTASRLAPRKAQYFDVLDTRSGPRLAPSSPGTNRAATGEPLKLFVSYSRTDGAWLERFRVTLDPLVRGERIDPWDDTKIVPGKWHEQIQTALSRSNIALFLVSARFLASDFIMEHELPQLLEMANQRRVTVLWVLIEDCLWEESPLAEFQGENAAEPLSLMSSGEQTRAITGICRRIRDLLERPQTSVAP